MLPRLASAVDGGVDPHFTLSPVDEILVDADRLQIDAHVVDFRQSEAGAFIQGQSYPLIYLLIGQRRNDAVDQVNGVIDEDPGRVATGVPVDFAPLRILCGGIDARKVKGCLVDPYGMPVDTRQHGRIFGSGLVERFMRRKRLHFPVVLIPSASVDPFTPLKFMRPFPDGIDDLPRGSCSGKIEIVQPASLSEDVRVTVHKARHNSQAFKVDNPICVETRTEIRR